MTLADRREMARIIFEGTNQKKIRNNYDDFYEKRYKKKLPRSVLFRIQKDATKIRDSESKYQYKISYTVYLYGISYTRPNENDVEMFE